MTRNHFPPHYAENISETNLPAELIPQVYALQSFWQLSLAMISASWI
jgi:hypothetical protein